MKKFLFTLAALFMAGSALADSGLYIPDFTLTQEDLGEEIELQVAATFSARISGLDVEFTYPDGIEAVFIEKGADADVAYKNSRGRNATASPALYGAVEPFDHVVLTLADNGYWQDPEGENPTAWVTYGVVKWEGGEYEEFLLLTIVADPTFKGGDIVVKTTVASGTDTRGGTVRENGEHAQAFYYTCHVTVEGAQAEPTEKPVITWTVDEENQQVVVTATGNGTVILYNDDIEVARGEGEATYVVPFTEDPEGEEMGFSATAQEEGKLVSEYALATVEVPGKPAVTEKPVITWTVDEEAQTVTVTATGNGTVILYNDDIEVARGEGEATYVVPFTEDPEGEEMGFSATAQEEGKLVSEYALATVEVPGKPAVTEKPVITWTVDEEAQTVTVTATGNGTVILYNDDIEVARGEGEATYVVPFTEDPEGEEMGFSATAQEEGKLVSEYALATVEVPGKPAAPEVTATPEIILYWDYEEEYVMISAEGDGTVKLYIDGMEVSNPFMYRFQDEEHEILVEATAQEEGKLISETASETVVIPAKTPEPPTPEVTEKPTITYFVDMDNEEVIITVTGNGTVILYNDDIEVARGEGEATYVVPFTEDPEGEEMGFSATAQEEGKEVSEYALATIEIPGKQPAPYETPAPEVNTELTDDAFVITATGEGTVVVYVQYIDNETGEMTVQTYEGVGSVVVEIPRGEDDAYINYWAVAQADDDAVPGMTEVEYYVEIPAKEEGPVIDPEHQTGWWIVLLDKNGNEIWYRINKGADASYTTTVTLDYGTYGEFYYDPTMSDAENDLNRPNVPFYFVVDGTVWGADEVMKPTAMGESQNTEKNKLYDGAEDYYTVPVGYSYTLGIFVDEYTGEYYVYCAQGKATDVEELNADKTVAGVRYFNLAGQEMQQADGMTIIVTTYTDGTTSAVKVMK